MKVIRKLMFFIAVVLVQVLVCNNIHLFDYAMPMIYVYFLMMFRRDYPRWGILLWCFTLGITLDAFSNTPGVASASATLIGLLQPFIFAPFIQRDSLDDMDPDMHSMGFSKFAIYSLIIVFIYCLVFYSLEMFGFFNWVEWLLCIGGSTALTYVLILIIENFRK